MRPVRGGGSRERQGGWVWPWKGCLMSMSTSGEWGDDVGNVVYASGWGLMVSLNNGKCQCCNITALGTSAQMMETLMGIAYWGRAGVKTCEDFRRECVARQMAYGEVWDATYFFLKKEAQGVSAILGWYPMINEYVGWWGDLFLGKVVGKLLCRWKYVKSFDLCRVLHAVECVRRGWWGVGDELHDRMYKCTEWPPIVVEGECEGLSEYARKVDVSLEVWHDLPCLWGAG